MKRILIAMLSVAAVAVAGSAQEKPKPPKDMPDPKTSTESEQFQNLNDEFDKSAREFSKEYRNAPTPEARKVLRTDFEKKVTVFCQRFFDLAAKDAKSEVALDSLAWIVNMAGHTSNGKLAMERLGEHHVRKDKIAGLCETLTANTTTGAEKLLSRIMTDNPNKTVQAKACFALGELYQVRMDQARSLEGPEGRGLREYFGADHIEMLKSDSATFEKKAEAAFETTREKYGDVARDTGTFGESAKRELFEIRNLAVGKPAPEIESEDLDGKKTKLSELRGRVVVLDIWATWCPPCRAMIPHERELVQRLKDKPFTLVSISFDDTKEEVKEYMEKEKMPWTHWFNGRNGPIGKAWNIKAFPTIYVLDAKGVIRFKGVRGEAMDKAVETLLAEPPAKQ